MKKVFIILIIGCLLINGIASCYSINIQIHDDRKIVQEEVLYESLYDILDQFQIISTNITAIGRLPDSMNFSSNITYAQSFIPQKKILTRIELNITRNETSIYDLVFVIRENLTGEDLVYMQLSPENILVMNFSWIEFDFEDIFVDVGKTYYMIAYTTNFTENWYLWSANNNSESYPNGCAWVSYDDGDTWSNNSYSLESYQQNLDANNQELSFIGDSNYTWDMCFKTYGRGNLPPESLDIEGPIEGVVGEEYSYEIYSVDPDGDDIFYYIDWGDNTSEEWIGPYSSGEIIDITHTWFVKGNYTIAVKARDTVGEESDWVYLDVSMPVNIHSYVYGFSLIQKILDLFPFSFQMLRQTLR